MPAMAVESGPAAGVVAAALVAGQTGHRDILSFDMGGTTAKASLIRDARYETTPDYEVGGGASGNRWMHGTGHPIRVPVIDLAEVSAGGGSIAWVDRAGALRVGPESAGADPGPVCYGRGGIEPTVTDCNLLLGYLDRRSLLGGALEISYEAAEEAIRRRLAEPLGLGTRAAAAAVIDVVNAEMAEALKIVSVQRGHDPRGFTLAAFGGAGPLHAAALAEELGLDHVLCPPIPGAFSALGLVTTDLKRDYVRTFYARTDQATAGDLEASFAALEEMGRAMLARAGIPKERQRIERTVDARYERQSYELAVDVPNPPYGADTLDQVAEAFHARHRQTYGHDNRAEPVQLVNVRLSAIGKIPAMRLRDTPGRGGEPGKSRREVWTRNGPAEARVLDRATLPEGFASEGPPGRRIPRINCAGAARLAAPRSMAMASCTCTSAKEHGHDPRSRNLRDHQERTLQDRRGDAGRARQDGLFADPEIGGRLLVRDLRCPRRDGGTGSGSADSSRLDARCGRCDRYGLRRRHP